MVVISYQITRTQSSNIHPLALILDTCALIFSNCVLFTFYSNRIMQRHPNPRQVITTRAREDGPTDDRVKQKWPREIKLITYAPGQSTLSDLSRIDEHPPSSFLCSLRPPSHHPSSLTSVYLAPTLHLLRHQHPSGRKILIHSFHMPKQALIANPLFIPALLRTSSFLTIHSCHANQTSQTHLKNIHFPSLSTSHTPCQCSV